MKRHAVTVLLLVLALALYAAGAVLPATGLLLLGGVFEGWFWWRVIRPAGNRSDRQSE